MKRRVSNSGVGIDQGLPPLLSLPFVVSSKLEIPPLLVSAGCLRTSKPSVAAMRFGCLPYIHSSHSTANLEGHLENDLRLLCKKTPTVSKCHPSSHSGQPKLQSQKKQQDRKHSLSLCLANNSPNLLRIVIRCRDHLSSGENRAGCADLVTCPSITFFRV